MQSSNSFSSARNGKSRPSNILSSRPESTESLPWPSPSFSVSKADEVAVSADPDRPSTQIRCSPTGRLPPTPLTATYKPTILPPVEQKGGSETLKLPGVSDLLAHTPPHSYEKRTVPLPSVSDHSGAIVEDAAIRTGYSPPPSTTSLVPGMPSSASKSGLFPGSSSEWTGDNASFASMDRRPIAPRPSNNRRLSMPISSSSFRNMPSSDHVQGLGLDLGDETPRLGSESMRTPTMAMLHHLPGLPGAPALYSTEGGRFPDLVPSSPIKPALRNWNTNLHFEDRSYAPHRPFTYRSFSDTPARSSAMERERTIEIEGGMPLEARTWGLALSTTDGRSYRRGDVFHRQDGSVIGPAQPRPEVLSSGPLTPTSGTHNFATASSSSGSRQAKTTSPAMPSSASKRSFHSTGLTPHIHKTRLTPSFASSSKGAKSAEGDEMESPSLKMKSKQRSEQLREQAEYVASYGQLPSDLPAPLTSSSSPTSPVRDDDFVVVQPIHAKTAPPSVSPRNKRVLTARTIDSNVQRMEVSPWGVFGINTGHDAWQPLGPPSLSKALGKLDLSDKQGLSTAAAMERDDSSNALKKARKGNTVHHASATGHSSSLYKERSSRAQRYSSENKENDVFGGAASDSYMAGKRKPSSSISSSPSKSTTHGQRRLINIR